MYILYFIYIYQMFDVIFVCCSTIITAHQIGAIVIRTFTYKIYHVL